MSSTVTLQNVILSYPHIFEKWAYKEGDTAKYSIEVVFPPEASAALEQAMAAMQAAADEKWPTNQPAFEQPWKQVKDGPYKDCWSFSAKDGQYPPDVVDIQRNPVIDSRLVFAGCKIHVNVRFYGTTAGGPNRVAVGLGPILIVDNSDAMTRLSQGGMTVEDAFASIAGAPAPSAPPAGGGPVAPGAPAQASPAAPAGPATPAAPAQAGPPMPGAINPLAS